jgi:hypothetical protein
VSGDPNRYAPFRAAAEDTEASVRERVVAYYGDRLARRPWPPASEPFGQALAAAVRAHGAATQELRAAIETCVAQLHAQGMPRAAVLAAMKWFVRHTATLYPPPHHAPSQWAADSFIEEVVHRCVVADFRRTVLPGAAPAGQASGRGD